MGCVRMMMGLERYGGEMLKMAGDVDSGRRWGGCAMKRDALREGWDGKG